MISYFLLFAYQIIFYKLIFIAVDLTIALQQGHLFNFFYFFKLSTQVFLVIKPKCMATRKK